MTKIIVKLRRIETRIFESVVEVDVTPDVADQVRERTASAQAWLEYTVPAMAGEWVEVVRPTGAMPSRSEVVSVEIEE